MGQVFRFLALTLSVVSQVQAAGLFDRGERHFESFSELESISADIIHDIKQDNTGFIWLATQKGLVRYDGYDFVSYRHDENNPRSLSGDYVQSLHISDGRLYVGTYSDGVSVYEPATDSFSTLSEITGGQVADIDPDVRALASFGEWLIIVSRSTVNLFHPREQILSPLGPIEGCEALLGRGRLTAVSSLSDALFIGSDHGLCRIDVPASGINASPLQGQELQNFAGVRVYNIQIHESHRAWVSTVDRGVALLDFASLQIQWLGVDERDPEKLDHHWVDDTAFVDGDVWVGTAGGGIAVVDPETLKVKEHIRRRAVSRGGLALNDISAIFVDQTGLVWLGTWGGGMNRFNPANRSFKALLKNPYDKGSLIESDVRSAREMDNGEVWLGGAQQGIQVLSPDGALDRHYPPEWGQPGSLQDGYVHAFEQLPNGDIWAASSQSGIYRYNAADDSFSRFSTDDGLTHDNVRALHAVDNQTLWLGTDAGLTRFDLASLQGQAVTLRRAPDQTFDAVIETIVTYREQLWVGTNTGLYVLPKGQSNLEEVISNPRAPLSDNFITDMIVDSRDQLWVITSSGVDILETIEGNQASFISVNRQLGLGPLNLGEAVEEDSLGRMWVQSNVIDPRDWTLTVIDRKAGWDVGNQWIGSNAKMRDGTILFGGTRGVLMIRPELYLGEQSIPRPTITRAEIDSRAIPAGDRAPLTLPASVKSFSLEFSALDYGGPSSHRYQYKLEGYDEQWTETSSRNRRATYSRLGPGQYQLRVRVVSTGGQSIGDEIGVTIVQTPKWFEMTVFRVLAASMLLSAFFGVYRWRVSTLEAQKKGLDALVSQRTENIRQLAIAGQAISESLDIELIAQAVLEHAWQFMHTDEFSLGVIDVETGCIDNILHWRDGEVRSLAKQRIADELNPVAWCVRHGRVLHINDLAKEVGHWARFHFAESTRPVRSLVYYPLLASEKVIGVLCLHSYEPSAYDGNKLEMLKTIAAYAAAAIDNAATHHSLALAKAEIEQVSLTDQLTGMKNRRFLENAMPSEVSRLCRSVSAGSSERLGVLLIDADFFKAVNDQHGHDAGDQVLIQLADIIRSACREMDWAIRLGGEEFLMMARVQNRHHLMALAERLRARIEHHDFIVGDRLCLKKTCSIGACEFPFSADDVESIDWEQAISIADKALYTAKAEGRNRWVAVFDHGAVKLGVDVETLKSDFASLVYEGALVLERSLDAEPGTAW